MKDLKISAVGEAENRTERIALAAVGMLFIVAILFAVAPDMGRTVLQVCGGVLFGWYGFLDRSLLQFQPDMPSMVIGITAFLFLFVAIHMLGRVWWRSHATAAARSVSSWSWRSTTAVVAGIVVMFAASIAMISSMHQLVWMATGSHSSKANQSVWKRPAGPLSVFGSVRESQFRMQSRNNMKQLLLGLHNYESTYGTLPPGAITTAEGRGYRGWMPAIGPFLSFRDAWGERRGQLAWDDPEVAHFGKGALYNLVHPELGYDGQFDDRGFALTHYAGNVHVLPNNRGMKLDEVTDGLQNTIAVGEVAENFQPWASPRNCRDPADGINDVPWGFGGPTWQNGAQFGFMDGSVRMISKNIDRKVLKALGTPSGNEPIPERIIPPTPLRDGR